MVRELAALSLFLGATCAVAHSQSLAPSATLSPTPWGNWSSVRAVDVRGDVLVCGEGVYGSPVAHIFGRDESGVWQLEHSVDAVTSDDGGYTTAYGDVVVAFTDRGVLVGSTKWWTHPWNPGVASTPAGPTIRELVRSDDGTWSESLVSASGDYLLDADCDGASLVLLLDYWNVFSFPGQVGPTGTKTLQFFERNASEKWTFVGWTSFYSPSTSSVAIDGDHLVMGGFGTCSVFGRDASGAWHVESTLLNTAGGPVFFPTTDAVDIQAGVVVAVDPNADLGGGSGQGVARIFELQPDGSWAATASLSRPNGAAGDALGTCRLVGDRVVLGSPGADTHGLDAGAADVFVRDRAGNWIHEADLAPSNGAVSRFRTLGFDGTRVVGGTRGSGTDQQIDVYDLPSLVGFADTISLASGGSQPLLLQPGTAHGDELFFLFGSVTGTSPGYPVIGTPWTLPLVPDIYFEYTTWTLFGGGLLTAPFGLIHPYGSAHSEFVVPPNFPPVFAGLTVHHAYALLDVLAPGAPVSFVSTPSSVTLVP